MPEQARFETGIAKGGASAGVQRRSSDMVPFADLGAELNAELDPKAGLDAEAKRVATSPRVLAEACRQNPETAVVAVTTYRP